MTSANPVPHLDPAITNTVISWPTQASDFLLRIRPILYEAAEVGGFGPLEESLKWGEPAWRPVKPRTGSTLRIAWPPNSPNELGLFVNCKTKISGIVTDVYPNSFRHIAPRALFVNCDKPLPTDAIAYLATVTFGWHKRART